MLRAPPMAFPPDQLSAAAKALDGKWAADDKTGKAAAAKELTQIFKGKRTELFKIRIASH